ncbi:MAG: hypothetical protein ACI30N_06505 [Muribaculaceae bacterium]
MRTNDTQSNFEIENIEDQACQKSNAAKKVAITGAMLGAGAGAAFAANEYINTDGEKNEESSDKLSSDELKETVTDGVKEKDTTDKTGTEKPQEEPVKQEETKDQTKTHQPEKTDKTEGPGLDGLNVKDNHTTEHIQTRVVYDEDGNIIGQVDAVSENGEGTIYIDMDGDGKADVKGVDSNHDGRIQDNEYEDVRGKDIAMHDRQGENVFHVNQEGEEIESQKLGEDFRHETTVVFHDKDGNVITQIDAGTYEGHEYRALDTNNDGMADKIAIDINNDGEFTEDEIIDSRNMYVAMENREGENVHHLDPQGNEINPGENLAQNHGQDNIDDIPNNYERTGDHYGRDMAQNNRDYNNHGNTRAYAGMSDEGSDVNTTVTDNDDPEHDYTKTDDIYGEQDIHEDVHGVEQQEPVYGEPVYEETETEVTYEEPAAEEPVYEDTAEVSAEVLPEETEEYVDDTADNMDQPDMTDDAALL